MKTMRVGDLEWQLDVNGRFNEFHCAVSYALEVGDGWRLPRLQELLDLRAFAYTDEGAFLLGDYGYFWTSDTDPCTDYPWSVNVIEERMATDPRSLRRVRLVREAR